MLNPNEYQVGGNHYKQMIQHWDIVAMLRANYFIGCATKYMSRFERKNGAEDLEKAAHFITKAATINAPPVTRYRMWRHKRTYEAWLHAVLQQTSTPFAKQVERVINDTFNGEYQSALNTLRYLIPAYRNATEPTRKYVDQ